MVVLVKLQRQRPRRCKGEVAQEYGGIRRLEFAVHGRQPVGLGQVIGVQEEEVPSSGRSDALIPGKIWIPSSLGEQCGPRFGPRNLGRPIGRSVVDENPLHKRGVNRLRTQRRQTRRQPPLFVEKRHDHREQRAFSGGPGVTMAV